MCIIFTTFSDFVETTYGYGHQTGDQALIKIAHCLTRSFKRADDYCFRLGGEEFGILFRSLDLKQAINHIEQLRSDIEGLSIKHSENLPFGVITASFGLIAIDTNAKIEIDHYYRSADQLLYEAKNNGRNRVFHNSQTFNSSK